ncbi:MAG: S41 family peptidase [Clostridiales bacterium]|nr:S41 family peptidase [Clostridiales bacterium]
MYRHRTKERFNINAPETERWITPKWDIQLGNNDIEVENESIIIVLMDGKVASAGEDFVKLLRRFKRVIFVGENSAGALLIGNVGTYLLPNSNIKVTFGFTMFEDPTKKNKEWLGLSPDFWVAPEDALERVIKMIRKYDLEKMNSTDMDS